MDRAEIEAVQCAALMLPGCRPRGIVRLVDGIDHLGRWTSGRAPSGSALHRVPTSPADRQDRDGPAGPGAAPGSSRRALLSPRSGRAAVRPVTRPRAQLCQGKLQTLSGSPAGDLQIGRFVSSASENVKRSGAGRDRVEVFRKARDRTVLNGASGTQRALSLTVAPCWLPATHLRQVGAGSGRMR